MDDAAIFPPGNAPLEQAVADHVDHRDEEYADLVGGFVVSDLKVADLAACLPEVGRRSGASELNLVVTGGAGAIEPAVTWVSRSDGLSLRAVEFALRDEEDLAHNAQRLIQVVDSMGDQLDDVTVFAEPPVPDGPPSHGWLAALDELAAREIHLKFRTGGVTADLFPGSARLAACIEAALDRELPFKCTAGLHNAVRHRTRRPASSTTASSTSCSRPAPASTAAVPTTWPRCSTRPTARRWPSGSSTTPTRPRAPGAGSGRSGRAACSRRTRTSSSWGWSSMSWVPGAAGSSYDVDHLPYGVFSTPATPPRVGVRIGDFVLDASAAAALGVTRAMDPTSRPRGGTRGSTCSSPWAGPAGTSRGGGSTRCSPARSTASVSSRCSCRSTR